jgi:hypothetical protein
MFCFGYVYVTGTAGDNFEMIGNPHRLSTQGYHKMEEYELVSPIDPTSGQPAGRLGSRRCGSLKILAQTETVVDYRNVG